MYLMKKGHLSQLIGYFLAQAIGREFLSVSTKHPVVNKDIYISVLLNVHMNMYKNVNLVHIYRVSQISGKDIIISDILNGFLRIFCRVLLSCVFVEK